MAGLRELLRRQGHFLLENETYSLLYIAILALLPFATWLSAAIVALITLREGSARGGKGLLVGIASVLSLSFLSSASLTTIFYAVMAFLPCFLMAVALRVTKSWRITIGLTVFLSLIAIALLHGLFPQVILEQIQLIQVILQGLKEQGVTTALLTKRDMQNPTLMVNYLVGIEALSFVLSAVVSLMLARSVQSSLFYPQAYRQEMLGFRATPWGGLLLVLAVSGAYYGNALAISSLPILVVYYLSAAMSLILNILAKGKRRISILIFLLTLIFLPFITLPLSVVLGILDSLFDFRTILPLKAKKRQNKGF